MQYRRLAFRVSGGTLGSGEQRKQLLKELAAAGITAVISPFDEVDIHVPLSEWAHDHTDSRLRTALTAAIRDSCGFSPILALVASKDYHD